MFPKKNFSIFNLARTLLLGGVTVLALSIDASARQLQPSTTILDVSGPGVLTFQGIRQPDPELPLASRIYQVMRDIHYTTADREPILLGGIGAINPVAANQIYNSVPYGNCGTLAGITGSALSSILGLPFRFRSSPGHVFTEVEVDGKWYVADGFVGLPMVRKMSNPKEMPLFTLDEMAKPEFWESDRKKFQYLYKAVVPTAGYTFQKNDRAWKQGSIILKKGDKAVVKPLEFNGLDIFPNPGRFDLTSIHYGKPNESSYAFTQVSIDRPIGALRENTNLEYPFMIFDIHTKLNGIRHTGIYPELMRSSALKVTPKAPDWARPLTEVWGYGDHAKRFIQRVQVPFWSYILENPSESWWIFKHMIKWTFGLVDLPTLYSNIDPPVLEGEKTIHWTDRFISGEDAYDVSFGRIRIDNDSDKGMEWVLDTGYVNKTDKIEYFWSPFVYQSDTPFEPARANNIGSISTGYNDKYGVSIMSKTRGRRYADLIFPVDPGDTLRIMLRVAPGKRIEIMSFGEPDMDIGDIISPINPVMAVNADISGIPSHWDNRNVAVEINMLVNGSFRPEFTAE